jgi:hypothetical protein
MNFALTNFQILIPIREEKSNEVIKGKRIDRRQLITYSHY